MLGIILNRRNLLIVLMCIEILLLCLNINFALSSAYLDDVYGQLFSLFILTIAAAESGIGLAIVIAYYKKHQTIKINQKSILRY